MPLLTVLGGRGEWGLVACCWVLVAGSLPAEASGVGRAGGWGWVSGFEFRVLCSWSSEASGEGGLCCLMMI